MKRAFQLAVEASYYAGKLYDKVTDPDISEGRTPPNYTKILVPLYGHAEDGVTILSGQVPDKILGLFEQIAELPHDNLDDEARTSLGHTLATLQRVVERQDPAPGYITHFSNLQGALIDKMPKIQGIAQALNLT